MPVSLMVPIHDKTEVNVMGALEYVLDNTDLDDAAKARCVDWLHAKYGSIP